MADSNDESVDHESVDDLIARKEIPKPTVVKIDIEGAEMMALQGMSDLLRSDKKPRALVLELHPLYLPAFDTNLTAIFKFLIESNYQIAELASREDQVICTWTAV